MEFGYKIINQMLKSEEYDHFCRFFRALRSDQANFTQHCLKALYQLENTYKTTLKEAETYITQRYNKYRKDFEKLYQLADKTIKVDNCEQDLFHSSTFAKSYDNIINWFKSNRQKNISEYVLPASEKAIKSYQNEFCDLYVTLTESNDKNEPQKSNSKEGKVSLNKWFKHEHAQNKEGNSNPGFITVEQILQLPKNMLEQVMSEVNKCSLKEQLNKKQMKRLKKVRNKQLEKEVGSRFCEATHQLKFQYLPKQLREKLGNSKQYQLMMKTTLCYTVKNIEMLVEKEFGFRRMTQTERISIMTDLKNYGLWMSKDEGQLFLKAVKLFNEIDTSIEISAYQIFVLYVLITNKFLQNLRLKSKKNGNKDPVITQNESPKNIRKELTYLYYHYDSLEKIKELFLNKYFFDSNISKAKLEQEFKLLIIDTYHRISKQQSIENKKYERIMTNKKDYNSEPWITIATNYVEYQIQNTLSDKAKDYLKKMMEMIVSQHEPKVIKTLHHQEKSVKSHIDLSNPAESEDQNSIILSFKMESKERKEKVIRETKVIKIQEDSSNEGQQVD